MLINFNFSKKIHLDGRVKIFLNVLFISGIFLFKSALMRSDPAHIKYSSGIYTLVFIFLILFFFFDFLKKKVKKEFFLTNFDPIKKIYMIFLTLLFLYSAGIFEKKDLNNNYFINLNILNFPTNIVNLVKSKDELFLKKNSLEVLKRYKELSAKDDCIQILTDDIAFSYLLKKKTCTQFYIPAIIITKILEEKFIAQLKLANPEIILYDSENKILLNKLNMPKAMNFVDTNYAFSENFNGYVFYKKNNNKF